MRATVETRALRRAVPLVRCSLDASSRSRSTLEVPLRATALNPAARHCPTPNSASVPMLAKVGPLLLDVSYTMPVTTSDATPAARVGLLMLRLVVIHGGRVECLQGSRNARDDCESQGDDEDPVAPPSNTQFAIAQLAIVHVLTGLPHRKTLTPKSIMHVDTVRHMTMHTAQVCHRDVLLMMRKIVRPVAILPSPVRKMPTASTVT
ncbi:hypothetical protein VB005_09687 [Metarhizium brunneum]